MRKFLSAMLCVILACCIGVDSANNSSLKQTRDDPIFMMEVVLINPDKIEQVCSSLGVTYRANGCSKFEPDKKKCTIYVMPQRYEEDRERLVIIGHEVWHCRFGLWHD